MDNGMGTAAPDGGDDRLGQPGGGEEDESREIAAAELEIALRLQADAACRHFTACGALHVRYGDVTPEDLRRATLSSDMHVQVSRLEALFTACGIVAEPQEVERADVIRVAAECAPQSDDERRTIYQLITADYMAMHFAGEAMSRRHLPPVAALFGANFAKMSKTHAALQDRLQVLRRGASSLPTEIHGHLHLHAGDVPPVLENGRAALSLAAVTPSLPPGPDASGEDAQ